MNHALLYIEDDENNISLVQALLKRRPQIELHVAMNGHQRHPAAIDEHRNSSCSTTGSPTRQAPEILRKLSPPRPPPRRSHPSFSSDFGDIIDELLANGAIESVAKPFDIHQFMAMIDRYLP